MDPEQCVIDLICAIDDHDETSFDLLFDALIIWLDTDGFIPDNMPELLTKLIDRMSDHYDLASYVDALRDAAGYVLS